MPVLTISAVDSTADNLTVTAHGLTTGDLCRPYNPGNGSLPAPLATATDVWAIRLDANTIRLASSNANALAGTPINLTTNGSGLLYLLVGIPFQRATTYVAGISQIKSVDLNAMEDALRDNWTNGKHGVRTKWITASQPTLPGSGDSFTSADVFNFGASGSMQGMPCPPMSPGDRITEVKVRFKSSAATGGITLGLFVNFGNGSPVLLATITCTPVTTWATYGAQLVSPHTMADGEALYLSQTSGDGLAHQIATIGITYDRP